MLPLALLVLFCFHAAAWDYYPKQHFPCNFHKNISSYSSDPSTTYSDTYHFECQDVPENALCSYIVTGDWQRGVNYVQWGTGYYNSMYASRIYGLAQSTKDWSITLDVVVLLTEHNLVTIYYVCDGGADSSSGHHNFATWFENNSLCFIGPAVAGTLLMLLICVVVLRQYRGNKKDAEKTPLVP